MKGHSHANSKGENLRLKLNHFPAKKLDGEPGAERICDWLDMETCFKK